MTFTIGALLPLIVAWAALETQLIPLVALFSLVFLTVLGALAARAGGAPILRVIFWGALAMAITAGVDRLFGVTA